MIKVAPPPAPAPLRPRVSTPMRERVVVVPRPKPAPILFQEPEPEPVQELKIKEPEYVVYEPLLVPIRNESMTRYFWSENASRPIPCKDRLLHFTKTAHFGGIWQGYFKTDAPEQAQAIVAFSAGNRAFREVTATEFEKLTGIKQESAWKLEDFMGSVPIIDIPNPAVERANKARIIHCVQRWKHRNDDWDRRVGNARASWVTLYMSGDVVPCHYWDYKRSSLDLGDKRCLPYLKDILEAGLSRSTHESDIIMLTNDDSILHPRTAEVVFNHLKKYPVCCSGRVNFVQGQEPDFTQPPNGSWEKDIGRDLFAMRKSWLKKNWKNIPDVLVADIEWDLALSALFRKEVKAKPTIKNRVEREPKSEIPPGYVFHEVHGRSWDKPEFKDSPVRRHCVEVMRKWYHDQKLSHMITI